MKWLNGYRMRLVLIGFMASGLLSMISVCSAVEYVWTQRAYMPTPRWGHTSAVVNGKIYAIGGRPSEGTGGSLSTVEEYDPTTDTWTRKADMPTARRWLAPSSPVVDGKIYVIGGRPSEDRSSIVEEYDPATDTWTRKADMPTPRSHLATCAVNGKIYAIGGLTSATIKGSNIVEEYDPATDTWTEATPMPTGVWSPSASVVDGKIYVVGGARSTPGFLIMQVYDPQTDTWTSATPKPKRTRGFGTSVLCGKIYAVGGWSTSGSTPYSDVYVYDPTTDKWTAVAPIPERRACLSTSVVAGKIYAIGGTPTPHPCPATSTVYEYEPNPLVVDFNGDGIVDSADMSIMVDHWHTDESFYDIAPVPCGDGIVDVQDLVVLAEHLFEEVDDPTLVAHWKLDETEGDIAYDSAGENNAVVFGDALWQPAGGQIDGALAYDGTDDYVSTEFVLNPADGVFSVVAWIMGGAPGQVILSQIGGANWLCTDSSGGNLMTELLTPGRGGNVPIVSETVITDSNWHRIGFVWDGSYRYLYVDGAEVAKDTKSFNILESSDGGLYLGAGNSLEPAGFFSGLIDDVRIYDRAVTP